MALAGDLLSDIAVPPIMAGFVWLSSTGWGMTVSGGKMSERIKKFRNWVTLVVLALGWAMTLGIPFYRYLMGRGYHP
jgi:hypothetical protein